MEVAQAASNATAVRRPRAVRMFSVAILAAALTIGGVLVALGEALPSPGPVLLLALVVALCVNRFALFPSEQAATAEAAVLLAAVVGFRGSAPWLGPLCVALLVGPLDSLHWQQRSFLRMAYNAGNRGLAVLAASAALVGVVDLSGASPAALGLALVAGTLAFAVVDAALSVVLLQLQGEPNGGAIRQVLDIDALTVPIAFYGAAGGLLAGEMGWWAAALALIPVAFVPELVLARARWRVALLRNIALALAIVAALTALALVAPVPRPLTLVGLLAIGALGGTEFGLRAGAVLPPLLAIAVIAAVVAVPEGGGFFAAGVVAVTGAFTSSLLAGRVGSQGLTAAATATAAGILAAGAFAGATGLFRAQAVAAIVAGATFEAFAVLTAGPSRRRSARETMWTAPVLGVAAASAVVWRVIGIVGSSLFVALVVGTLALTAGWGSPPWCSRVVARWHRAWSPRAPAFALFAVIGAALGTASIAVLIDAGHSQLTLVWVSVALGEAATAAALVGVRQWRFLPRGRVRDATALFGVAAALVLLYPVPARAQRTWSVLLLAALLLVVLVVAGRVARRISRSTPAAHR
ncbi:MAG: hypothetical protein QOF40_2075 [Actinomycetota bacterium]|nr:hypothetical protein [Actinomycetota bacterium]